METQKQTQRTKKVYMIPRRKGYKAMAYTAMTLTGVLGIFLAGMLYGQNNIEPIVLTQVMAKHTTERVYLPPTQDEIINEIVDQARQKGVSVATALQIAECESGYNAFAVGKNRNGTNDKGVFQINSIHGLNDTERLDYKKNIDWAIKKMAKEGFDAWYSSAKCWK